MLNFKTFASMGVMLLLVGCGGGSGDEGSSQSSSKPTPVIKDDSTVPADIQGYYEALVTADNGDSIAITLSVQPDGEYIGIYNNAAGETNFKKEVFSLFTGNFKKSANNQLETQIREFDSSSKTIRNYPASAQYVPLSRVTLDLVGTDASIDKKVYDLTYVDFKGPTLSEMVGEHTGVIGSLTKFTFAKVLISDTNLADTKSLQIDIGSNCQFLGTIEDKSYRLNQYPYSGVFSGQGCTITGRYSGLMYEINNMMLIQGTNNGKTDVMRFVEI